MIPLVNLERQHKALSQPISKAIDAVFAKGAFIGGPFVAQFEQAFAMALGDQIHCVGVSSGTSAISLVLEASDIGEGDEVILPAHTFAATAEAVCHVGATPVFADVRPSDYAVDPVSVASLITERTRAVIPVHIYGSVADLDGLRHVLPRDQKIVVIEDAAQAHIARYKNSMAGTVGDAGTFSFYPGKNLGACGDAGAVTCHDDTLATKVAKLRDHGRMSKYEHDVIGYNHRMDGIQGAILTEKLSYLPQWTARRQAIAARYDQALGPKGFKVIESSDGATCVYHLYVVEVSNRDAVQEALGAAGIVTGVHYPVPLHRQPAFACWSKGPLPVTEQAANRVLSLPICPYLTDDEQEQVISSFLAAARP